MNVVNSNNTIAVAIDVQEKLFDVVSNKEFVLKKSIDLSCGLSALSVPVLLTEQYPKGLGYTVSELKENLHTEAEFEKISFSCFGDINFREHLASSLKTNVVLFGIEAHVCVLQTALDLLNNNYNVFLVVDAISSRSNLDKDIAVERMKNSGAILTTTESILFEICKTAGTEQFKKISKIIK